MTEIKTSYGVFGNYKDLYMFMCDEGLSIIHVEHCFMFSRVSEVDLSIEQVKDLCLN